ncbi:MAG: SH3 domain-containing protein [Planctomycetota bacterium]|nr:SH3 domain-containing protein [Planctomycetota bacterium]
MSARFLALFSALFMLLPLASANEERAIDAYRRGDLATARTEWTALLDSADAPRGMDRARILYDLGNVSFREGKTLEAVGWYTASLRLRPRDADTWTNLEEARSRAKLEPADRGDLSSTLKRVMRSLSDAEARWLALGGILVVGAALAFEALRGGRLARWIASGATLLALASFVPCIDHGLRADTRPLLVIQPDGVALKSEPRDKSATTSELNAGAIVRHVDDLPEWTKVRIEGGLEGFVPKSAVFAIER